MAKLQKSIDKQNALLKATLTLINNGGIQAATMAKIATLARVSPATMYLYFENKQDMINHLYLDVKTDFGLKAFKGYDSSLPVKKCFEQIWFNIAEYKLTNKEEASFLSQCDNAPLVDMEVRKEGLAHLQPLIDLWDRGQKEGIIKDISPFLLYAYSIYPMAFFISSSVEEICPLEEDLLQKAFQAAWDSIKM